MLAVEGPLARYHLVLSAIAEAAGGMHAADLSRATGLPRSTAHRIATALSEIGYLRQLSPGRFELGSGLDRILSRRLLDSQRTSTFIQALRHLTDELGEAAFCARLDENRVEITDVMVPTSRDRVHVYPGIGKRPLDRCSSSRAILAFREDREVDQWLESDDHLRSINRTALHSLLAEVRRTGYAVCDGEIDEGIFSLACPIYLEPFCVMYSIGVTGPVARIKERKIKDIVSIVAEASKIATEAIVAEVTTN
jgi:DNA-binding IclR family transcriptional regulator